MAGSPFQPAQFVFCDPSPDALLRVQTFSPTYSPPRGPAFSPPPASDATGAPFVFPTPHRASLELPALPAPRASVPPHASIPPDVLGGSQLAPVAIARSRSVSVLPQAPQAQARPPPPLPPSLLQCKSGSSTPTVPPLPPAVPCVVQAGGSASADGAASERLEMESHSLRLELSARLHADTKTGAKYQTHYNSYVKWWTANAPNLLAEHEIEAVIPALPITAMKVSFFLQHEIAREKLKHGSNETIAGSSLGASHISGVVSALEKYRKNYEHLYKQIPEAQKKLRDDARISEIERSMRHNEPRRNETANALKASGTSSDAYTPQDLQKCSLWCLSMSRTATSVFLHLRDRAMLLVSAGTAFRGDSTRNLEWSDLFITHAPMPDISPDSRLQVLGILSDNAKHNQQGRVDEHGLIRHRLVELCPVGAMAFLFWAYFHVLSKPVPDFVPDFNDKEFGEFGRRDWYSYHLFYAKDISKAMTYENHRGRLKDIHFENDVSISKVTHASRHYGAQNTRSYGASIASTKAMGGWNESGMFRGCYDRAIPLDALLASAMFNGQQPSSYFLARDVLEPPGDLLCLLFPWVEQEQRALAVRAQQSHLGIDIALESFLNVLVWFRRVLLQDAAILYCRNPNYPIFTLPPFNLQTFRAFAGGASERIAAAEREARAAYQNLPQAIVQTMQSITTDWALQLQQERKESRERHDDLTERVTQFMAEVQMQNGMRSSRKRRQVPDAAVTTASTSTAAVVASGSSAPAFAPMHAEQSALSGAAFPPHLAQAYAAPPAAAAHAATAQLVPPTHPPATAFSTALPPPPPPPVPSAQPAPWLPSNPLPSTTPDARWKKREELRQRYGDKPVTQHPWQLVSGIYVPSYVMQPAAAIEDIWTEYTVGLNGYLPVRALEEYFGPKWRGNVSGIKTEWGRRKKVIALVQTLSSKPRWDVDLALRFLRTEYAMYSSRKFCEYLQSSKLNAEAEILERARSFT